MIQANELRIGNYIQGYKTLEGWKPLKVEGRHIDQFERELRGEFNPNCPRGVDNVEGIPITPEILKSAGFRDMQTGANQYIKQDVRLKYNPICKTVSVNYRGTYLRFADLISLHQIQNLYFALTGEELIISI